jgi:hypothetical protein
VKTVIPIDHAHTGIEEFLLSNVTLIHVRHLKTIQPWYRAPGLRRPQLAAVAKGRGDIALPWRGELRGKP